MAAKLAWTAAVKAEFLRYYVEIGTLQRAAAMVGLTVSGAQQAQARDPEFARQWAIAAAQVQAARVEVRMEKAAAAAEASEAISAAEQAIILRQMMRERDAAKAALVAESGDAARDAQELRMTIDELARRLGLLL